MNMKLSIKLLSILAILTLSAFIFVNAADDEDSITATVTFQHIALTATDGSISYGILAPSQSKTTVTIPDSQTIENTGNVAEDFDIKGLSPTTGGTCTNWTIGEAAGAGVYSHEWSINGGTNWYPFVDTYEEFASNISASGTSTLDLRVTVPSSTDCYVAQNVDVTVMASAH